ncbi:hypothetical protein [Enterobacter sp.]|uniref:hypothetical protein n=1 Tax=Enterobacter sp. TaxID=42895 RepID=UPI00296E870E|nr:hypothetical protein [Enterobacter sp.]
MKKTGIVVGLFTAIAFCAGAMAATEPESGRFSFQARTPEPKDHFITLKIQSVGPMPNDGDGNQVLGVNVYWKTKDKNQLQGRTVYSSLQPNLPRFGQNFSDTNFLGSGKRFRYEGNHENIEWLVWEGVNMDFDFNNGCPPTAGNTHTRFYYYRFKDYTVNRFDGDMYCSTISVIPQPRQEDVNVALTSFAVSHESGICNRMGEFCIGAKEGTDRTLTKDIYIPSWKLEFLAIEVFGFEYNTNAGRASQSFYNLPIEAIKFTPSGDTGNPGKMNLLRGDRSPAGGEFSAFGVSGYTEGGEGEIRGYYNAEDSRFYLNEEKTEMCGQLSTAPCSYDFTHLDTLVLNLQYTNAQKIPKWETPFGSGVIFTLEPKYFKDTCQQDRSQCNFPSR